MNVAVKHCLARGLPSVNAHVETFDARVLIKQFRSHLAQERLDGIEFRLKQLEIISHMTLWDDQGVSSRHRKPYKVRRNGYAASVTVIDGRVPPKSANAS